MKAQEVSGGKAQFGPFSLVGGGRGGIGAENRLPSSATRRGRRVASKARAPHTGRTTFGPHGHRVHHGAGQNAGQGRGAGGFMAKDTAPRWDRRMQQRLARGEAAALGELYDRFAALVHSQAHRMLDDEDAADLVTREVFAQVWENPEAYDPKQGSMRSWVARLTHRRSVQRLRPRRRLPLRGGARRGRGARPGGDGAAGAQRHGRRPRRLHRLLDAPTAAGGPGAGLHPPAGLPADRGRSRGHRGRGTPPAPAGGCNCSPRRTPARSKGRRHPVTDGPGERRRTRGRGRRGGGARRPPDTGPARGGGRPRPGVRPAASPAAARRNPPRTRPYRNSRPRSRSGTNRILRPRNRLPGPNRNLRPRNRLPGSAPARKAADGGPETGSGAEPVPGGPGPEAADGGPEARSPELFVSSAPGDLPTRSSRPSSAPGRCPPARRRRPPPWRTTSRGAPRARKRRCGCGTRWGLLHTDGSLDLDPTLPHPGAGRLLRPPPGGYRCRSGPPRTTPRPPGSTRPAPRHRGTRVARPGAAPVVRGGAPGQPPDHGRRGDPGI